MFRAISRARVARLLRPRSVAVVGVSEQPLTPGRNVIATLDRMNYLYLKKRGQP